MVQTKRAALHGVAMSRSARSTQLRLRVLKKAAARASGGRARVRARVGARGRAQRRAVLLLSCLCHFIADVLLVVANRGSPLHVVPVMSLLHVRLAGSLAMKVRQGGLHVLQVVGDVGAAVEVLVERRPQDFD